MLVHRFISPDSFEMIAISPTELTDKNLFAYCDNNPVSRADYGGEFWNVVIGAVVGAVAGGILGGITASKNGQDVLTGVLTGATLGAVAGTIAGSGNVSMISSGLSSVVGKAATDTIGATFYGSEFGTWEDYTIAFVLGGVGGFFGGKGKIGKIAKDTIDVAGRPLANQLVKCGTRGKSFDGQKYAYDVATRFATLGGSKSVMRGNIGNLNLGVDMGKCFYRATTRAIYSYLR